MPKILIISDDEGLKAKTRSIADTCEGYELSYSPGYAKIFSDLKTNPHMVIAQLRMPGRINFEGLVGMLEEDIRDGVSVERNPLLGADYILYSDDLAYMEHIESRARDVGMSIVASVSKEHLYGIVQGILGSGRKP